MAGPSRPAAGAPPRLHQPRHLGGAPLLPPAVAYLTLVVAGVVVPPVVAGVAPYGSDADLLDFYTRHPGAAHLLAFFVLASAVPFTVFTAVASHRVRVGGLDVPGRLIALAGGAAAAGMLAASGSATLALTRSGVTQSDAAIRALDALAFATGGPGFVVFSGLLLAGISVPALVGRLVPRWIGWFGLVVAASCALASLAAATDALDLLLPVGRFGTMIWMVLVALTLTAEARDPAR